MTSSSAKLKITVEMPIQNINWKLVRRILQNNFNLSETKAIAAIDSFTERFAKPLNHFWKFRKSLSGLDVKVVLASCETHGADILILKVDNRLRVSSFGFGYVHEVQFEPNGKSYADRSVAFSVRKMCLRLLGYEIALSKIWHLIVVDLLLLLLGTFLTVLLLGFLLYGLAITLLFWWTPIDVTLAATQNASIGLGLICVLVGGAGIFGRAIKNILNLVRKKLEGWFLSSERALPQTKSPN